MFDFQSLEKLIIFEFAKILLKSSEVSLYKKNLFLRQKQGFWGQKQGFLNILDLQKFWNLFYCKRSKNYEKMM